MRKLLLIDAVAILVLFLGRLYISGPVVVDREEAFHGGLHNTLYYLDQAKSDWAEKESKTQKDVPTISELVPYMGDKKSLIDRFTALGVRFTITPFGDRHQTDGATLTKDVRFNTGFCRFYPAGTNYSLQGERIYPQVPFWNGFFQQNWAIMFPLWVMIFVIGNAIFYFWFGRRLSKAEATSSSEPSEPRREGGVEPPQPGL